MPCAAACVHWAEALRRSDGGKSEEPVSGLTLFGACAVSLMLISYALEQRSPRWVLVFAGACAASSTYGFLAGTWPFGVVEGIWTLVAVRRWLRVRG